MQSSRNRIPATVSSPRRGRAKLFIATLLILVAALVALTAAKRAGAAGETQSEPLSPTVGHEPRRLPRLARDRCPLPLGWRVTTQRLRLLGTRAMDVFARRSSPPALQLRAVAPRPPRGPQCVARGRPRLLLGPRPCRHLHGRRPPDPRATPWSSRPGRTTIRMVRLQLRRRAQTDRGIGSDAARVARPRRARAAQSAS